MRKPVLMVFYQFNPGNTTIGGIQTLIQTFIKYAPKDFEAQILETGNDSSQGTGKWLEAEYAGLKIQFSPLFKLKNDNIRDFIPTIAKYTSTLFRYNLASDFMHFHEVKGEPTVVPRQGLFDRLKSIIFTKVWQREKTLFIHNEFPSQIPVKGTKKSMLGRYFPGIYLALEKTLVSQLDRILSCNTETTASDRQWDTCGGKLRIEPAKPVNNFCDEEIDNDGMRGFLRSQRRFLAVPQ